MGQEEAEKIKMAVRKTIACTTKAKKEKSAIGQYIGKSDCGENMGD